MGRVGSFQTKNGYQSAIRTYKERRKILRERCKGNWRLYSKKADKLNKKIRTWTRAIKRIEEREHKLKLADECIIEFFGVSVKTVQSNNSLARNIFYKWCIENGVNGKLVADYIGLKRRVLPCEQRLKFTRSFLFNQYNHQMWRRFIERIKSNESKIAA